MNNFIIRVTKILSREVRQGKSGKDFQVLRCLIDSPFFAPDGAISPSCRIVFVWAPSSLEIDDKRVNLVYVTVKSGQRGGQMLFANGLVA